MPITGVGESAETDPVAALVSALTAATAALTSATSSSLQKSSNLSDLASAATARANLGLPVVSCAAPTGTWATDKANITAAVALANVSGGIGVVQMQAGHYNAEVTLPPGVLLVGVGPQYTDGSPGRPGTYITNTGSTNPVISSNGEFMHSGGLFRLQVRSGLGHGIVIDQAGENFIIEQVAAVSNAGDGIRITGAGTPVMLGHITSLSNNGGYGLNLVSQTQTAVQVLYVGGDNNVSGLVGISDLDTTSSVHIVDWKSERWGASPGNPVVFDITNGNGGLIDLGNGRINIGSGVTAGTAVIRQQAPSGSVGRVKWRYGYLNSSAEYTYGYQDVKNSITLTMSQAARATVWMNEPLSALSTGSGSTTTLVQRAQGEALTAGTGSPEGVVTANPGSLFMRSDGTAYLKNSGTSSTNWTRLPRVSAATAARSGRWVYPIGGTTGAAILSEGAPRYSPIIIDRPTTIVAIGLEVTLAGTSGALVRLGLYADDGSGLPTGSPLVDAGTIDGTSATFQSIVISLAVNPGLYWGCAVIQGAAGTRPTIRTLTGVVPGVVAFSGGQSTLGGYTDTNTNSGALSTPSPNGNASGPFIQVKF